MVRAPRFLFCLAALSINIIAASVQATPIAVAGFTFADGERSFADDAFIVSGVITGADNAGVQRILVGSNIADSFNTGDSGGGIVEVRFLDNVVVNGPGTDLVIFELSGDQPPGTPDPREVFGFSVWNGTAFSSFTTMTPIATGFPDPADATLDIFKIEIDLSSFGLLASASTDRVRLHIYNANLGSKSADLTALGAMNSSPVPEPASGTLVATGLLALFALSREMRCRT